jgi:hypothetical protein
MYRSTDYGLTWSVAPSFGVPFSSVAVSGTGQYQVATYYHALVTSSNYGETWSNPVMYINDVGITDKNFRSVAISYNGAIRAVVGYTSSNIYISYDYGATWVSRSTALNLRQHIKMSSSGQYMITSGTSEKFEYSTDFGETWITKNSTGYNGGPSAISPDGSTAVSLVGTYIYTFSPSNMGSIIEINYFNFAGFALSENGRYATSIQQGGVISFKYNFNISSPYLNNQIAYYEITKGDQSGTSVSLAADGSVVAIGAPYSDSSANIIDRGQVRVWTWNGTTWSQRGNDIFGEATNNQSGFSVSMSADGNTVAIGAPYNNGANGIDSGHVRVYKWNGTSWVQA